MPISLTYKQITAAYSAQKRAEDMREPLVFFVTRPLSFPLAWLAIRAGLHPNHVSGFSFVVNALGLALMASGRRSLMLWGVFTVFVALVLDCVDGSMARATKQFTQLGPWLDGLSAYLLYVGFHVAGGTGAWLALARGEPVSSWPRDPAYGGVLVALAAVAAASMSFAVMATAKFGVLFPEVGKDRIVDRIGRGLYGMLFTIGRNLSFPSGLVLPITFAAIAVRRYDVVLAGYAALNAAMAAKVIQRSLSIARRAAR